MLWGKTTVTGTLKNTVGRINPLRYRGYYYDSDVGLYYLQSRYYDSEIGRFINADEPEMIFEGVDNLFGYCDNNPVMFSDETGFARNYIIAANQFYDISNRKLRFDLGMSTGSALNTTVLKVNSQYDFKKQWNKMSSLSNHNDIIVLFSHGNPEQIERFVSIYNYDKLNYMYCKALIIISCNAGNISPRSNKLPQYQDSRMQHSIAYYLSKITSGYVVASDGTVQFDPGNARIRFESVTDKYYWDSSTRKYNLGWLVYNNGKYSKAAFGLQGIKVLTMSYIVNYLKLRYNMRLNKI